VWAILPDEHDWGEFVVYLTFFVYGYLLFSRPAFVDDIYRQRWIALCVGVGSLLLMGGAYATGYLDAWAAAPNFTVGALLYQVVPMVYIWACLAFVLACGVRWLNFPTKRLPEANEAVLPFYILHQPAIVLIAYYVVQWPVGILPKWLVISMLALALVLGLYLLIRRVSWMRWLFGMKPRQPEAPGDAPGDVPERLHSPHSIRLRSFCCSAILRQWPK
jgi:glucan biosynthesis protein C